MGAFASRPGVVLIVVSSLAAGACAGDEGDEADPTVEVGYSRAQAFEPMEAGDPCWVSEPNLTADLTVRMVGMSGEAGTITCAIFDDDLGPIAYWHSQRLFAETDDGGRQVALRLALDGVDGFDQIDGHEATLHCEVIDEGGLFGDRMVDVVLTRAE